VNSSNKDKDVKAIAKEFFAAYDAHDVEGMLGLCADGAQGRYTPYGRDSVVPIRGGLDGIWRAFPQVVPNFRVEVVEMLAERTTVIAQAVMSGPLPADVPGIAKKAQVVFIPHAYFLRFNANGKITRLDAYWDNTVLQGIKQSAV
jgi:ketosteroid isomerase-like protein